MSWNYRIVHYHGTGDYGLHEVHYDENDKPIAMTKEAAGFVCNDDEPPLATIGEALCMALSDAMKYPILEEPENWTVATTDSIGE